MFTWHHSDRSSAGPRNGGSVRSLLQFARVTSSSHADWIHQAVEFLRLIEGVERVGVWLEEEPDFERTTNGHVVFSGEVWEQGIGGGAPEWSRLSDDMPIPEELLHEGKSCEYDLDGTRPAVIVGLLVGLGHVLWLPVMAHRSLRGIVFLGSRAKHALFPRGHVERIPDELALLLELEQSRKLAASRKADLELNRYLQSLVKEQQNANMILNQLVESCTRVPALGGVGATFALVAETKPGPGSSPRPDGRTHLELRAQSGETDCAYGVNESPLESLWHQALDEDRTIGADAERLSQLKEGLHLVAIPLGKRTDGSGVLVAGFPKSKASLEILERLEFRAVLASEVLERERTAKTADERRAWYDALLESSETPLVLLDESGFLRGMSRGACELLGPERTAGDLVPGELCFAEIFQPSDRERVDQWVRAEFLGKREEASSTIEVQLGAGARVILSHIPVSGGTFLAIRLDKCQDQKRSRKVEEVEEDLRQTIEWLEEGVLVFDQNNGLRAHNTRALQILGLHTENDQCLRNLDDLIQGSAGNFTAPELFAAEWRVLANNGSGGTQEELAMERPIPQVIERCTKPIFSAAGKRLGRVEVYREVTARRMFQSRMVQAEKLATLGQHVTAIMHELSNPLTNILGNAQRLILRGEEATQPPETRRILEEAGRATTILRQLLDVSREVRPDRRLVSLNEIVERTTSLHRNSLCGSSLSLRIDTAVRLPRIFGDATQLQQVLLNLLQNAQQAIELSGRGTTIGVRTLCAGPDRVRLEVWDDGPGIPEALQARVFEPFFTTKPPGTGTGLGLAIVNDFIHQHGGSISVQCQLGGGTRVLVHLPVGELIREAEKPPLATGPGPSGSMTAPSNGNKHDHRGAGNGTSANSGNGLAPSAGSGTPQVLVVEDESTVANLIADVLREQGMRVDVFLDGQSALEAARRSPYDLAICDVKMPGMDGHVFYGRLQQEQNPLRDRTLFVTGDTVAAQTRDFLEQNRLPRVAKPFRIEELCQAVQGLLGAGNACSETSAAGPHQSEDGTQS